MKYYNLSKKRIQIIRTRLHNIQDTCINHKNNLVILPMEYRQKIDFYWQEQHKGWISSPLAQLEDIYEFDGNNGLDSLTIKTSVTEYCDHIGSDILSRQGDISALNLVQALGNSILIKTNDNYFVFGKRGSNMTVAPDEYDGGGSLMAAVYALDNGMEKLRSRASLPANERYSKEELLFQFSNPLEHVIPSLVRERGIDKEYIKEDSLCLLGFCRGDSGGRNPNAIPYLKLSLSHQEYILCQKEKINWLEKTTGKKQDKKIVEAEHEAFIHEDVLEDFLLNRCIADSLGKKLKDHPKTGRYEVVDVAIGGSLLYLLHYHQKIGLSLIDKLAGNWISLEFLPKGKNKEYKFNWADTKNG